MKFFSLVSIPALVLVVALSAGSPNLSEAGSLDSTAAALAPASTVAAETLTELKLLTNALSAQDCDVLCTSLGCEFPLQQHRVTIFGPDQEPNADAHFHECMVPASCGSHLCEPDSFASAGGDIHRFAQQLAVLDPAGLLEVLAIDDRGVHHRQRGALQILGCHGAVILNVPLGAQEN